MKTFLIAFGMFLSVSLKAHDWYRIFLVSKISAYTTPHIFRTTFCNTPLCGLPPEIPRFERPKGAIFCRMEDYMTAKTKVWLKVGVK